MNVDYYGICKLLFFFFSGAKLCMILDLLGDSGSVAGVDVARQRVGQCCRINSMFAGHVINVCRAYEYELSSLKFNSMFAGLVSNSL